MNTPVLLLIVLNFTLIGLLPRVFFRHDGRLNVRWWVTALPFGIVPGFLIAAAGAGLTPVARGWLAGGGWLTAGAMISVVLSSASIGLICLTLGTHRIPIALWHQDGDAPQHIVTYGAYRWIRHPFYAAFLLAFGSAAVFRPHWVTLGALGYALVALNLTARREEQRLAGSEFGAQYRQYLGRTGRFVPRAGTR